MRVTIVEGFNERKVDPILQTLYIRILKTIDIISLPRIRPDKNYVLYV